MSDRFVVLSGCSGSGKSTLLAELQERGHSVVDEPGRRIVKAQLQHGGTALPWIDAAAFARQAIDLALADRSKVCEQPGWVFFDRSLIDAASALEHVTSERVMEPLGRTHRYNPIVFFAPPWPEIYVTDAERRHGLEAAVAEYHRLAQAYPRLGYRVITLPKTTVEARADRVLDELAAAGP